MRRKLLHAILIIVLLIQFFIPLMPHASAQGDWCREFDFTVSDGGWDSIDNLTGRPESAVYSAGVGWISEANQFGMGVLMTTGTNLTVLEIHQVVTGSSVQQQWVWGDIEASPDTGFNNIFRDITRDSPGTKSFTDAVNWNIANDGIGFFQAVHVGYETITTTYIRLGGTGTNPFGTDNCTLNSGVWCYEWDFTAALGSWTLIEGTYSGTAVVAASNRIRMSHTFSARTVDLVRVTYSVNGLGFPPERGKEIDLKESSSIVAQIFEDVMYNGNNQIFENTGSASADEIYLDWVSFASTTDTISISTVRAEGQGTNPIGTDNCTYGESGGYSTTGIDVRHLLAEDTDDYDFGYWQTSDQDYDASTLWDLAVGTTSLGALFDGQPNTVFAASESITDVFNLFPGEVVWDVPISETGYECNRVTMGHSVGYLGVDPDSRGCFLELPPSVTGQTKTELYFLEQADEVHIVKVVNDNGITFTYLVKNSQVNYGDNILAGCILGETIPLQKVDVNTINFILSNIIEDITGISSDIFSANVHINYAAAVLANDSLDPNLTYRLNMSDYYDPLLACNVDPGYTACLNPDPKFAGQGEFWTLLGGSWDSDGVYLFQGDSVTMYGLPLPETAIGGSIQYTIIGSVGFFNVQLGQTLINVSGSGTDTYQIASLEHLPDIGNTYTFSIKNTGSSPIIIKSACLTDGEPNLRPGSCYFPDPGFEFSSSWDVSAGVQTFTGEMRVPDAGYIGHQVHLYPNEDESTADYNLRIKTLGVMDNNGMNYALSADLTIEWPIGVFDTITQPDESIDPVTGQPFYSYETTLSISTDTDALLTISPTITGSASGTPLVRIDLVCLEGPFPQQGGGGEGPPFDEVCDIPPAQPIGDDFGDWIGWHWGNLNQFFQCQLMVLLNKIYSGIQSILQWIKDSFEYQQFVLFYSFKWLDTDLFPWLGGHFHNMAVGESVTVYSGGEQCGNIFCLFTSIFSFGGGVLDGIFETLNNLIDDIFGPVIKTLLDILYLIFNVFIDMIERALNIVYGLIEQMFNLFDTIKFFGNVIISAWQSAAPIPIEGMPQCGSNPDGDGFCITMWLLDNTILSGPGALLIPLLVGFASIMLLIWVVGQFKQTVVDTGKML